MRAEQMTAAPPQRQAFTKDSLGMARAVRDLATMLAVTIVLVLSLSGIAVAEPGYSFDTTPGKLPKAVIPLHSAIELTPDLTSLKLAGAEVVDVEVPSRCMAVGSMPVVREDPVAPNLKQVAFAPTAKMSSYLFVLTAGELERLTAEADGVTVGVVTSAGKSANGRFALENAVKLLTYYNDYSLVKYPLPKLDLIAVPGGFGGAMENWGGITFFESRLLLDPATYSATARL